MGEDLRPLYNDAFREGYRAGQLAMRERAAHTGEKWYELPDSVTDAAGGTTVEKIIGHVIRALEPEEPE